MKTADETAFYILYSQTIDKYYTGITTGTIQERLHKHNTSFHGNHFTSAATDWTPKLVITCQTYSIARKMELYVKRMKSRKFIEKIIADPNEQQKLIDTIKSI